MDVMVLSEQEESEGRVCAELEFWLCRDKGQPTTTHNMY
jgi:hypothetical protein